MEPTNPNTTGIEAVGAGITGVVGLNTYSGHASSTPLNINTAPAIESGLNHIA